MTTSKTPTPHVLLAPPESVEHAPVWLSQAIEWARSRRATDLHFFPAEKEAALWVRVDGELREAARYSPSMHQRMIARLKVMGRCADYAGELVQEGRFSLNGEAVHGEARFSIIPTLRGEKAVIRLLTGSEELRHLDRLGFSEPLIAALRSAMDRPQGLILAVGPSGCGKSTALYALLHDLHSRTGRPISMLTIEDPVERSLPFAAQITADASRGLGFAECLRATLRQDPEVILIGEIRDAQTAETALQAALTGHRLLSSMHTLTAAEAMIRLRQMGSAPYVIASALAGILNVRLVKLLCPDCKRKRDLTDAEKGLVPESKEWPNLTLFEPVGCDSCMGTGFRGRTAVGGWLIPTAETQNALVRNASAQEIAPTLQACVTQRDSALEFLSRGEIAIEEFQRAQG